MDLDLDHLRELQEQVESRTASKFRKLKRFVRLAIRGIFVKDVFSELEHFILQQPNDCSIVSANSSVKDVGECSLSCLHISSSDSNAHELPVVLFLHGLGGQMSQFESFFSVFAEQYEIFSLDLPGFGNSKACQRGSSLWQMSASERNVIRSSLYNLKDFSTDNIVKMVCQYIQKFIGDRKLIIVAHSMGTHLATKVTSRITNVEALVLISPPRFVEARKKSGFKFLSWFPTAFSYLRIWDRLEGLKSHSLLRQVDASCSLEKKARQLRWNLDISSKTVLEYIKGFKPASARELLSACEKLGRSKSKVMIMCGEKDKVTPISSSEETCQIIQDGGFEVSLIRIPQCGHAVLLEKGEMASSTVLQFIA